MKYWNPYLETLPREILSELELHHLRKLLQYATDHSPFYRTRYKDVVPKDINTKQDVRRLPLLDVETWCHILWMAGFRETDRVFIPFGYNVYVALALRGDFQAGRGRPAQMSRCGQ